MTWRVVVAAALLLTTGGCGSDAVGIGTDTGVGEIREYPVKLRDGRTITCLTRLRMGAAMTFRVQWTRRGYFASEFHDFTYAIAAEHFADILREIGRHNVTTHQLDQEAP